MMLNKKVLLVTHQLSRTGAVGALYDLALLLHKYNYEVEVVSLKKGPMEVEYEKCGIKVAVQEALMDDEKLMSVYMDKYEFIVVNTLACTPFVAYLSGKNERVYWWIHENELHFQQIQEYLSVHQFQENIKILAAGKYIQGLVNKYMRTESDILNIVIKDVKCNRSKTDNIIRFAQVGLLDGLKGQEIFVAAIIGLEPEIRNQCEFYICGDKKNANPEVLRMVEMATRIFPCLHYLDSMERTSLYQFYDEIDCIVVPSVIESMSAVMIECFMKEKIGICTNNTGISAYMTNGQDGFVFETNNGVQLKEIIEQIVKSYDSLGYMRKNGRMIYENNFTEKCFEESVQKILEIG